jgi:hypothetical protein
VLIFGRYEKIFGSTRLRKNDALPDQQSSKQQISQKPDDETTDHATT